MTDYVDGRCLTSDTHCRICGRKFDDLYAGQCDLGRCWDCAADQARFAIHLSVCCTLVIPALLYLVYWMVS
jgi:hypothetical protein